MTSRTRGAAGLLSLMLLLTACGGGEKADEDAGPDRSSFEQITVAGVAALVDRHLGDKVTGYTVFADEDSGRFAERSVQVTLKGADADDTFTVSVYPPGGSQGQVVTGECAGGADSSGSGSADAAGNEQETSCTSAPDGGNVTITRLPISLATGNRKGSYLTASGSGPTDREALVTYDAATKRLPVSDEELQELLADPLLGWETDPEVNREGEKLTLATQED